MKILTVWQPWAGLFFAPWPDAKDVENRTWSTTYRGRLCIHAGKRFDEDGLAYLLAGPLVKGRALPDICRVHSAILGVVDLVDVYDHGHVHKRFSRWHVHGQYGFYVKNPIAFAEPIGAPGGQGLHNLPPMYVDAVTEQIEAAALRAERRAVPHG